MKPQLETLLQAAVLAPSGDNTQPWRFFVDDQAGRIALAVDETRDPSPMNAGQRMARIAVGAALENILRTARYNHWPFEQETPKPPALAQIRLLPISEQNPGKIEDVLHARHTNRRVYDGRPLADGVLERLQQATPPRDGVYTHWLVDRNRLPALAKLIGQADAIMFGEPSMRQAFLAKVRFDAPANAKVEEGLSLASLELSWLEKMGLHALRRLPNWLLHWSGAFQAMGAKARKLVNSASGLCLITADDSTPATDVRIGQALQAAWLTLTAEQLAAQPMMSLPVLENVLANTITQGCPYINNQMMAKISNEFAPILPKLSGKRLGCLLRFGTCSTSGSHTGRLPWPILVVTDPCAFTDPRSRE